MGFDGKWIDALWKSKPTFFQVDNIDAKIAGLTERGFADPQKMIASLPAILGLAFDNIDAKIALINRLATHYRLGISAPELMEQNNALIGSKIDKLWVLARVARDVWDSSILSPSSLRKLLYANLEYVVLAQHEIAEKTFTALIHQIGKVKNNGDGRAQKRQSIASIADSDPIARRYLRGYPLQQ